ncbi:hypothetical protein L3N51_02435 [Metallosphaera sp. J1]|uniref:hypothetical protein n=1 Tax=Metallosphaera javensis (ex Hofmann et al. 2022) TaxID=99938 RepID=UPI001EDE8E12|nr:hypothetical protein [Metallosphaera javensis (ex Hofmann et al. 2022)]MCG3110138.1 hypothetical protein [Metallosphaera javensis (ex Hofmann et al. 2022)]
MIEVRRDMAWLSAGFSFLAIIFYQGFDVTLGRTVFANLYEIPLIAISFNVLASVFLALSKGYYIYAIPLSFLSYIFWPEVISVVLFLLAITALRGIPSFARDVLLGIDAFAVTYVILAIVGIRINLLMLPVAVIQVGAPILIPLILLIGIIYGYRSKGIPTGEINLSLAFAIFVTLMVTTLPFTGINSLGRFLFPNQAPYVDWLLSPSLGKFFISRPLYLALLYILGKLVNATILSQWQIPVLSLIFVLSAHKLGNSVRQGMGPLAALLAGVSPTIIALLYSNLEANILSLSFMFLSLSYLLRSETGKAILLSYLSMLSHIFTWTQLEGTLVIFTFVYFLIKRQIPCNLKRYVLLTGPALLFSLILLFTVFSIPIGFSLTSYLNQITLLSWGTVNALLFFTLSVYGLDSSPRMIYAIFTISVLETFVLNAVQNLIIDIPFFIPASLGVLKLDSGLRVPLLLLLVVWGLIMSLNSFPYLYGGVTI